jgi:hypothetical protein
MKITTAAYSVDGVLLPTATYEVRSDFKCDMTTGFPEHVIRGLWVQSGNALEPIYLTKQQLETISHDFAF